MRILLLGTAAIALSGCSWLGLGGSHQNNDYGYSAGYGQYGTHTSVPTCQSSNCLSRWNIEGGIGPSFLAAGDLIDGSNANGPGANINTVNYKDAFKPGIRAELGGSYALAPNRKVTATGFYQTHESDGSQDLGFLNGQQATMEFSDYNSYGGELGLRQYFRPTSRHAGLVKNLRPYVEGKVGGAYVESIQVENATLGGQQAVGMGRGSNVTQGGWVPTAAGMFGVETPLFKHTTLGVETGIRYTGKLSADDTFFGGANPLAGFNEGSGSWSVPVTVRGRYRF